MVPNGWRLIALENIADPSAAIRYGVVQIGEHTENGIPIVPIKFIKSIDTAKLHRVSASIEAKYKNSRIHTGDVLISVKGTIGAVGIVPEGFSGNIAREIARIRPSVKYDSNYIAFQLQADHTQREIENLTVGTTRKEFSIHTLKKFEILVPPLNEQQKIVKILSTWDQAISATEKLLENSQQQKKALMQQLLTGKKRLLDENGVRFSEKWRIFCLADIAEMNSGGTPKSSVAEYYDGGIPWVSIADMTNHGKWISTTERTLTSLGVENSSARLYPKNTILYAMYASIGECSIAKVEVTSSQAILGIRPKDCLHYEFLYFYLCSLKDRIKLQGQQGTQSNLNAGMVKDFKINLPNLKEQQAISNVLNICDEEILVLQKKLDRLKQEKKALMQQLLTGKKRVKVAA